MTGILFLLVSDVVPVLPGSDEEHILVEAEDDGASAADAVHPDSLACVTTLVTDLADEADLRASVIERWRQVAGVEPHLERLASDPAAMSADQRAAIADLEPGSWTIRTPFVLFRRGSQPDEAEARRLVTDAALRRRP